MTSAGTPHILLIEDNPCDVQLFELALMDVALDCKLSVLHDGEEALGWIDGDDRALIPDLAVIDLNLPKYEGLVS